MEYNIREFRVNLKGALDKASAGEDVFLNRGGDVFSIKKILKGNLENVTVDTQAKEDARPVAAVNTKEAAKEVVIGAGNVWADKLYRMKHYGCGCERAEKKLLCPVHNRM